MSFAVNEQGQLVRLVEQEVGNEEEIESQLQNELDEAQNNLNTHSANVQQAESELAELESQAEAKENELNLHKAAKEAAEARVQKSVAEKDAWAEAKRLRDERAEQGASEELDDDSDGADDEDGDEPAESEAQDVPVTVAAAG